MTATSLAFEVQAGPAAGPEARRAISAGNGWLADDMRGEVLLLVTELVTNAVRHGHAGSPRAVQVTVHGSPERVRVEVIDAGAGFDPVRPRPGDEDGGWGLYLVERVADRWGVTPAAPGCCVWFELELQAQPRPAGLQLRQRRHG